MRVGLAQSEFAQWLLVRFGPDRWLVRALARPGLARRAVGDLGEELAARALARAGYRLVGRNVAAPEAELDAVALAGPVTVVVEVKCGVVREALKDTGGTVEASGLGRPGGTEDLEQRAVRKRFRPADHVRAEDVLLRRRAARRIAARGAPWRVDVVEVTVRVGAGSPRLELAHFIDVTGERPWPWEAGRTEDARCGGRPGADA